MTGVDWNLVSDHLPVECVSYLTVVLGSLLALLFGMYVHWFGSECYWSYIRCSRLTFSPPPLFTRLRWASSRIT